MWKYPHSHCSSCSPAPEISKFFKLCSFILWFHFKYHAIVIMIHICICEVCHMSQGNNWNGGAIVYLYPKLRMRQKSAKGHLPIWFHVELSSLHSTFHSLSPYLYPSTLSVKICWSEPHVPSYSVALNWLPIEYNFPLLAFTDKLCHQL